LDINPFEPLGVGTEQLLLVETLMLDCLLRDSPRIATRERQEIDDNQVLTAQRGREPGLCLQRQRAAVPLREWAHERLTALFATAELLDGAADGARSAVLRQQLAKVADSELTPSAQVVATLRARGESLAEFTQRQSLHHRAHLLAQPLLPERHAWLTQLAADSHQRQRDIEAADTLDFDDFLAGYFAGSPPDEKDTPSSPPFETGTPSSPPFEKGGLGGIDENGERSA
jgi:glutamate--cysteine ligase